MVSKSNSSQEGIAIIVPMYNEQNGARNCVIQIMKIIKKLKVKSILIVVNDGSTDNTLPILNKLKPIYKNKLLAINHKINKGYGAAIKTGIRAAYNLNYKYAIIYDSDLTNEPKHILAFEKQYSKNWDLIKGSRFIKGGRMVDVPVKRQIFSFSGNMLASLFFNMGIKDCTNGLRMVKTKLAQRVPYIESGFPIIMEELYYFKKFNAKCTEIPNILKSRTTTESTFSYTPKLIFDYFKYALKAVVL